MEASKPSTVYFRIRGISDQKILREDKMEIMHGMPIHVFVTQAGLDEYHHVHPQAVAGQEGLFSFTFTPQTNRPYKMFADLHPKGLHYQALQAEIPSLQRQPMQPAAARGYQALISQQAAATSMAERSL